jgi:hypothetical protein
MKTLNMDTRTYARSFAWSAVLPKKATWVLLNRLLAWALLLWPVAAIAVHPIWPIGLVQSLACELGLLVAHAALSVLIFGVPMPQLRSWVVWFWGVVPLRSKPRAAFLINGWAVAVSWLHLVGLLLLLPAASVAYDWLLLHVGKLGGSAGLFQGLLGIWWVLLMLGVLLRIPLATLMHVGEALSSFFVRQRWMSPRLAPDLGFVIACFYVFALFVHVMVLAINP